MLLVVLQIVNICRAGDDVEAVAKLEARHAQYQRKTRALILSVGCGQEIFQYGPVWDVQYQGVIDDELMQTLVSTRELSSLSFGNGTIPDRMVVHYFADMLNVEELTFVRVDLHDDDLAYVARMPRLRRLFIISCSITDQGLAHLHSAERLRYLGIHNTDCSDGGLASFRAARPDTFVRSESLP